MEPALAGKKEEKKTGKAAFTSDPEGGLSFRNDGGAPAGLPLFLQRFAFSSAGQVLVQRQNEEGEEIEAPMEEPDEEESLQAKLTTEASGLIQRQIADEEEQEEVEETLEEETEEKALLKAKYTASGLNPIQLQTLATREDTEWEDNASGQENEGDILQTKLKVNQPGDKFEQEADKTADKVIRMPAPPSPEEKLQRLEENRIQKVVTPDEEVQKQEQEEDKIQTEEFFEEKVQKQEQEEEAIQTAQLPEEEVQKQVQEEETGQTAELSEEQVQKQEEELQNGPPDDDRLQRKGDGAPSVSLNTQSAIRNKTTGGEPLSSDVRGFMEPRFSSDFSNVRIHSDPESAGLSTQLSARAFTYKNHIFFSQDQYQPGTSEGKKLLAHELTHTLQQGAVPRRKIAVSKVQTPFVQRGPIDWIKNKIKKGLDRAANWLVPGYTLLNVILGKNLITDEPVSRTGINIIKGYMRLSPVIGSILLSELEETKTLPEAGIWVEAQVKKFKINFDDLANRLKLMWGEMSAWRGIDYNVAIFKKYFSPVLSKFMAFSGVVMGKVKELRFEGALRLVGATEMLAAMKKNPAAFKRLVDNPKTILKYFMTALKQGFLRFKDNFGLHFKNAIFGWLFGKAAEMGIQMPKEFSAAGFFHLIAQLVGATYQQIRMQVVKKIGPRGEAIVSKLEKTVEIIKDLVVRGPIALWERVQTFLKGFKEMVFAKISELVSFEIIKAAVSKLVSMLNPVGAIVQLVLGIYRVVKFFIDRWDTIKQITSAILNSITNVALGKIAAAAGYIEKTMAKGITLIISFLASIFGLGGIVDKVRNLIKKISAPVKQAIGKVVGWIVKKGRGILKKLTRKVTQVGLPKDPNERLRLGMKAALAALNRFAGRKVGKIAIDPLLAGIKIRYGFQVLYPFQRENKWWVRGTVNPMIESKSNVEPTKVAAEMLASLKVGTYIKFKDQIWRVSSIDEKYLIVSHATNVREIKRFKPGMVGKNFENGIFTFPTDNELKEIESIDPNWKNKRIGRPQETRTPGHAELMDAIAEKYQKMRTVKCVYLDKQYRKISILFDNKLTHERRADIVIEHMSGRFDVIEVRSKSDKVAELEARNYEVLKGIDPSKAGQVEVLDIPGFDYSIKR
jgi:hypothetical protein